MFKYGFWWRFGCPRVIMDAFATPWKHLKAFGEKKNFRIFSTFFKHFLLRFSFKMKQKWRWKNRKCNFFKNEALNWKSATVKVLGYMLTVSDDCEDPPTMKLAMPPASNSPHEIHGFQSLSELKNEGFLKSGSFFLPNPSKLKWMLKVDSLAFKKCQGCQTSHFRPISMQYRPRNMY